MDRRRIFTASATLAVAEPAVGKPAQLAGYAIRWNSLSDDRGGYKVRLLPGSAIPAVPTLALYNHDRGAVIGNTANGTLRLASDELGVRVEMDLPDTQAGRDTATLVAGGYVAGMSFFMTGEPAARGVTEGGVRIVEVSRFEFDEVSVLGSPAFIDTSIGIKHFAALPHPIAENRARLRRFTLTKHRLNGERFAAPV